jgi:septal ring factor EnvC (AmiA/AmiB activator)
MVIGEHFDHAYAKREKKRREQKANRQTEGDNSQQTVREIFQTEPSEKITQVRRDTADHERRKAEQSRAEAPQRQRRGRMRQGKRHGVKSSQH